MGATWLRLPWHVVRAEFRHLVKQHHPDHGGDADRFREVSAWTSDSATTRA